MPGTNRGKYLICWKRTSGVRLHRIVNTNHFLPKPLLYRGVTFLQSPQSSTNHFTARRISP